MFKKIKTKIKTFALNNLYKKQIESLPDIPLPENESKRLAALRGLNILDTPPDERFDRITETAATIFDTAISFITMVDANRQWFRSCYGAELEDTDKKISFCAYAILEDNVFVIPDTRKDPRFKDFPIVTGVANIRFYAGAPISAPDGSLVGTLCILDHHPRQLTDNDKKILSNLAKWAELEINSKQTSRLISERKKAQKALQKTNEKLEDIVEERTNKLSKALASAEELKQLRDRVIRIISHQLRTPMNAIRWNLEALLTNSLGKLKKEQEEFVRLVYESNVSVIDRLNDLLITLDIQQNKLIFKNESVEIVPIIQAAATHAEKQCTLKDISLSFRRPKTNYIANVDPEKLRFVVDRILYNAASYTKAKGKISITVVKSKDSVTVNVRDNGIGIPKDEQKNVFSRFFRASNAHTMQPDGSGIALFICSKYIDGMGGSLSFTSSPRGTTMKITLPQAN